MKRSAWLIALAIGCSTERDDSALRSELDKWQVESSPSLTERVISRADFGEEWPFTVESGTLRCSGSGAVTFTTESTTYAVNGTALTAGAGIEIEPIWAFSPSLFSDIDIADRIPLSERQEIFAQLGTCEDRAMERAEAEVPVTDLASLETLAELQSELEEECKADVRGRFGISYDEQIKIAVEGGSDSWSPAARLRISISPVIDAGLALCDE
ncbi:MAG: DUF2511 domain-containing protein [Gemmatimonadota bacterium]|nr:DUF2511 domain-containing protein [Gemmatimonadota bacterium]